MAVPLKSPKAWTAWDHLEDVPEGVRSTLERALVVPMVGDQELAVMEAAFMKAAVKAVREVLWREKCFLLLYKLQREHPSMKRRAMYRAIALHIGRSEHTIRCLCASRQPGEDAELVDFGEGA